METVHVGIIGAGYMGREHARCLRLVKPFFNGRLQVVGIADTNKETAEAAAREFEIGYATDDAERILNDPSINTVYSCVPTKFHPDIFRRAVETGKAVFLEKPFAQTQAQVKAMQTLLHANPVPCQVGFVLRFTPVYHVLKSRIEECSKKGSQLMTVLLRDDQALPLAGRMHFTPWRADPKLTAGGVLIEHGIHDIDIMEWFFGPIAKVRARSRNFAGYQNVEDYISIEFTLKSGTMGSMVHLWHAIEPHQSIRHFEIFFRDTFMTLDSYAMDSLLVRDNNADHMFTREDLFREAKKLNFYPELTRRDDIVFMGDYYAIEDYTFVRNVLEGKTLAPTLADGARAYGIVQACYWSAAHGSEEVDIEEFLKRTQGS